MSASTRAPQSPPPPRPTARLTIGVIGAGRVGTALGAALHQAGHLIAAITPSSQPDRASGNLPGTPTRPAAEVALAATDLLLLAVPDDALAAVVGQLPNPPVGQVVAHTSGAHGLAVLHPVTVRGAHPVALHPAMTFTGAWQGEHRDLDRLPGIGYGVTAPEPLRPFATRLVADLGGVPEWVAEAARPLYHAGLAHGANHLVTLVNEAADQLRSAGVAQPQRLLGPLLRAALDNVLQVGDAALTGPVARGDAGTISRHLAALRESAPASLTAYRELARRTADRALAAGQLPVEAAEPLLTALAATPAPPAEAATGPREGRR
ncbi:DUF2520 domain-containing protein [Natronosporangium hydrolyticum]|uniref:DUF2520 domain-containing protein n=1 Tax=Natronosporangium hydrolyticum TaxID=2811111 RepID=A0A895YHQ4_9ACTN|nr:Rossmann-like and DUF2520 domain-containing protein [Natronosporangium hydrolyticum]QSB15049.1 DUF2520 domain-containing protein [Natronosporangium hydrolyticum]